jgi:hypothetical protein
VRDKETTLIMETVHCQSQELLVLRKECIQLRYIVNELLSYQNMAQARVHLLVGSIVDKDQETLQQHFLDMDLDKAG